MTSAQQSGAPIDADLEFPDPQTVSPYQIRDWEVQRHLPMQYRGNEGWIRFFEKVTSPVTPELRREGRRYRKMIDGISKVPADYQARAQEEMSVQYVRVVILIGQIIPDVVPIINMPRDVFNRIQTEVLSVISRLRRQQQEEQQAAGSEEEQVVNGSDNEIIPILDAVRTQPAAQELALLAAEESAEEARVEPAPMPLAEPIPLAEPVHLVEPVALLEHLPVAQPVVEPVPVVQPQALVEPEQIVVKEEVADVLEIAREFAPILQIVDDKDYYVPRRPMLRSQRRLRELQEKQEEIERVIKTEPLDE